MGLYGSGGFLSFGLATYDTLNYLLVFTTVILLKYFLRNFAIVEGFSCDPSLSSSSLLCDVISSVAVANTLHSQAMKFILLIKVSTHYSLPGTVFKTFQSTCIINSRIPQAESGKQVYYSRFPSSTVKLSVFSDTIIRINGS